MHASISGWTKSKAAVLEMSHNDISVTSGLNDFVFASVVEYSFRGRHIEWFYFRPVAPNPTWPPADILEISNDDISATGVSSASEPHHLPTCLP